MTEETAGTPRTPRTEPGLPQEQKYIRADDYIEKLEREVAALTTQWDRLKEATSTEMVMRLRNQYDEQVARAEAAEAQRDELQKRIDTAVPSDKPCESPPKAQ